MAEKPLRVLLDLTDLYLDSIKYVWINVSPRELKTISDFKSSLIRKINLGRQDIKLFVQGGLLLEEETIAVLREDDTVKVQYEEQYHSFQDQNCPTKKHKSKKRDLTDGNAEGTPLIAKQHKRSRTTSADNTDENCLKDEGLKTKKRQKKLGNSTFPLELDNSVAVEDSRNSVTANDTKSKKHSKKSIENNMNLLENSSSFVSFETQDNTVKECKQSTSCQINLSEKPQCSVESLSNETLNIDDIGTNITDSKIDMNSYTKSSNNCPKKKRKRHRKRKKESELITINTPDDGNFNNEFKSFIQDVPNKSSNRKHVIYSDPSPYVQHLESDIAELVNLSDSGGNNKDVPNNSSTYVVSEIGSNVTAQSTDSYPKVSTPAQSSGCIEPSWQISLMQSEKLNPTNKSSQSSNKGELTNRLYRRQSYKEILAEMNPCNPPSEEIAPLNSMPEVGTYTSYKKKSQSSNEGEVRTRYNGKNSSKNVSSEMNFQKPSYEDFPPLNALPEVGTCIAYKVLELNQNYSPEVSEYKEGKIKSIDPKSEEIEIEFFYHEIRPGRTGKFENLKEDEEPPVELKTNDIIKWSLLIEPRLMPSST